MFAPPRAIYSHGPGLRSKWKDRSAWNQDIVSEWKDMSFRGLLFEDARTI